MFQTEKSFWHELSEVSPLYRYWDRYWFSYFWQKPCRQRKYKYIFLILKHCDEDCDTDSEILKKTIGLCERDIRDLDNMMEKTGQHHLARKVHNYRHF